MTIHVKLAPHRSAALLLLLEACTLVDNPLLGDTDSATSSSGPGSSGALDTTAGSTTVDSATVGSSESSSGTAGEAFEAHDDLYLIPGCRQRFPWSPAAGLLANDDDDEGAALSVLEAVIDTDAGGTVTILDDGRFEYMPPPSCVDPGLPIHTCEDGFSYTAVDPTGRQSSASVVLQTASLLLDVEDESGARFWPIDGKAGVLGVDDPGRTGVSVAAAGDFDGDGTPDIIIGAHRVPNGVPNAGEAYVVHGPGPRPERLRLDDLTPADGVVIRGDQPSEFAGLAVAGAGDVDGDGVSDVLVGAPGYDAASDANTYAGRVYVVYGGGPSGEILLSDLDGGDPRGDVLFTGTPPTGWAGFSLDGGVIRSGAGVGIADIDGDGAPDAAIGSPGHPSQTSPWDVPGRASWRYSAGQLALDGVIDPGMTHGYAFGYVVRILGDIDGDGLPDLAGASDVGAALPGEHPGRVAVWLSPDPADPAAQDLDDASATITGEPEDRLGRGLADVDLNNDGVRDLAIGAPGRGGGGRVYVVYGGGGLDLTDPTLLDQLDAGAPSLGLAILGDHTDDADVGRAIDDAGDFNGDGYRDLVIGSPRATSEGLQECALTGDGVTYVVFGYPEDAAPPSRSLEQITCGSPDTAAGGVVEGVAILPPPPEPGTPAHVSSFCTGWSVAGVGDVDGDGCDDILVGSPAFIHDMPQDSSLPGRAYVVYGFDPRDPEHGCNPRSAVASAADRVAGAR